MERPQKAILLILTGLLLALALLKAEACSRFTYTGPNNTVITGRSMDWMTDVHTDLWVFPAGITRVGANDPNGLKWTSKYGSVIASGYDAATTDGINSQGLDANLLYLANTRFPEKKAGQPDLSVLNWAQYMLDNYATVDEAVKGFTQQKLNMIAPTLPDGNYPAVHLALTDKTGDNAVFEYINGKLTIHHGKQYKVMTNEPSYDDQLALNNYWQTLKGVFLPGTARPEDRYVRASYYLNMAPQTDDTQKAVATVFSIIRNVSVPMSIETTPDHPNVAPTIWVSVADLQHGVYYFQSTDRPNVFWFDLSKLNLNAGAPIKRLPLKEGEVYAGEVSRYFVKSKPFYEKSSSDSSSENGSNSNN